MLADLLPIVHQLRSILGELGTEIQLLKDKYYQILTIFQMLIHVDIVAKVSVLVSLEVKASFLINKLMVLPNL